MRRLLELIKRNPDGYQARPRKRVAPLWRRPAAVAGVSLLMLAAVAGTGGWVWTSGAGGAAWLSTKTYLIHAAANQGLTVQEVLVMGRRETGADDLMEALGVKRGQPILAFDFEEARVRAEALPWVLAAQVERRLPDTIVVHLTERRPLALWQHQGRFALIDDEGEVIIRDRLERFRGLIHIVGADAPANVGGLIELLQTQPLIAERVEAAVLVGARRWDLRLKGGVDIKLPEEGAPEALARLAEFERQNNVLGRDVEQLDLRVPDRVIVRRVSAPPRRPQTVAGET